MSHENSRASAGGPMPLATSGASARSEHAARTEEHGAHSSTPEPRLVTRGETHPNVLAHIDWLAFTVTPPVSVEPLPWIANSLELLFGITRDHFKATDRGWQGYQRRVDLIDLGLLAYGGERQRGTIHVSLNAKACAAVKDWNAVRLWGETYRAHICRVDLAHDDFNAETVSVDRGLEWFLGGGFSLNGRPAGGNLRDDLGSGEGRTLYVGKRQNGKLCRIYEKGKQLGDRKSPWCRVEVELHNKSRVIPWDTLTDPSRYLAGAYPCLEFLSLEQSKIKTIQRTFDISYDQMCAWVRTAAGRALHTMCEVEQGDAAAVIAQVIRPGSPKRLKGIPTPSA